MPNRFSDRMFMGGIVTVLLSLGFFCIPFFTTLNRADYFGLFIPNFILAAGYFLALWFSGRLRRGRDGLFPFFLFLVLFLISAYSLNREMNVFQSSVDWLSALLVICSLNYIGLAFYEQLPGWIRISMLVILGVSLSLFIYMSAYLVPLYAVGVVGAIALGISLHVFVPLLFTIYTAKLAMRLYRSNPSTMKWMGAGASLSFVVVIVFSIQWSVNVRSINKTYRNASLENAAGLPGWVAVAQQLPVNGIAEKILKADLVYSVPNKWDDRQNWFWGIPDGRFNEQTKHDPLVMIAALFGGRSNLTPEDQIHVLESMHEARHQAQERLWSGEHLTTDFIKTLVQIWPQYGLSYTEKVVTVSNNEQYASWNNQEEAIYTFTLSEGAVVSALSLWIDGVEEKAVLTSKQKADSAYKTIVGRERRDPSVVHWQEGNKILVRVFPVVSGQSRKFKIGITAPLNRRGEKMMYQNAWFQGPDAAGAKEEITVECKQPVNDLVIPASLQRRPNTYTWKGDYQPDWEMAMQQQPLSTAPFSFNGNQYTVRPYQKQRIASMIQEVYLDINQSWTDKDFEETWNAVKEELVFVYDDGLIAMNEENKFGLFDRLRKKQFSLFPFAELRLPGQSLVITKCEKPSPNLRDINGSRFYQQLKTFFGQSEPVMLYGIGEELSPFLKTLKEYRCFRFEWGGTSELHSIIQQQVFATNIENEKQVVLDHAGIMIEKTEGALPSEAPDHLMRLFAYNHVMQQKGKSIMDSSSWDDRLVKEATEAYVVSPVSSLVVLEKQADYERFNIKDSNNSLKNAAAKANGASPEPHEWALILLSLLVVAYLRFPRKFKWQTRKA